MLYDRDAMHDVRTRTCRSSYIHVYMYIHVHADIDIPTAHTATVSEGVGGCVHGKWDNSEQGSARLRGGCRRMMSSQVLTETGY